MFEKDGSLQPIDILQCSPKSLETVRGTAEMSNFIVLVAIEKICRESCARSKLSEKRNIFVTYNIFHLFKRFRTQKSFTILNVLYANHHFGLMEIQFKERELVKINIFGSVKKHLYMEVHLRQSLPKLVDSVKQAGIRIAKDFRINRYEFNQPAGSNLCGFYTIEFAFLIVEKLDVLHVVSGDTALEIRGALLKPMVDIFHKKKCTLRPLFLKVKRDLKIAPATFSINFFPKDGIEEKEDIKP